MPTFIVPNSYGSTPLREFNDCHGPADGKFCSGTNRGPLSFHTYPSESVRIPTYLKDDVAQARAAGIVTYHHQQPEPVLDSTGVIHDPLAKSNARRGEESFYDKKWGSQTAPRGRVHIYTRGGVFEPEEQTWGHYGVTGRKKKDLTPEMLTNPATIEDIVSTYRHEVGHIMDANFGGGGKSTPPQLAREIRAWTYAVEVSPDHMVSDRMVHSGLGSHAYHEFRVQEHLQSDSGRHQNSWDRNEWADRMVQVETQNKFVDAPTVAKAHAFADRVAKSLTRYGAVLRKKGIVRIPKAKAPWFPKRSISPGPGRQGGLL